MLEFVLQRNIFASPPSDIIHEYLIYWLVPWIKDRYSTGTKNILETWMIITSTRHISWRQYLACRYFNTSYWQSFSRVVLRTENHSTQIVSLDFFNKHVNAVVACIKLITQVWSDLQECFPFDFRCLSYQPDSVFCIVGVSLCSEYSGIHTVIT